MKPQDSRSPQIKFVPRYHQSPVCGHSSSSASDSQVHVASKHQLLFAGVRMESKSSVSGGKAKPRSPNQALSTTPTLTRGKFFITTDENPAAGKESKATKKTSQSKNEADVS